jgi:hypothetical protein
MSEPIDSNLLGHELQMTTAEIVKYKINCGPAGSWENNSLNGGGEYSSDNNIYRNYRFRLRSCNAEPGTGLFYVTITRALGGKRKTRQTRKTRKSRKTKRNTRRL